MTPPLEWTAGPGEEGLRLDVVLARHLGQPRTSVQRHLAAGEVCVDGRPTLKSHRVTAGERIVLRPREAHEPVAVPPPVPVRYEDDALLVVAKPAGLVVHPGAGVRDGTLVDALRAMDVPLAAAGGPERPGIVHRLDRGTSGLLVVAKSDEAYHLLVDLLARHRVDRRYWAIAEGVPVPPSATIDAPIARDPQRRTRFRAHDSGRPAVTHYDVMESFGEASRLAVRLETGRTHQVRVHLAAVGHPIAGDELYGASPELARDLELRRPALHAVHLGFTHPLTGGRVEIDEQVPSDLERALEHLRSAGRSRA